MFSEIREIREVEEIKVRTPMMDAAEIKFPIVYDALMRQLARELYQLDWRTNPQAQAKMRCEGERRMNWGLEASTSKWAQRISNVADRQPTMFIELMQSIMAKDDASRYASPAVADILGVPYKEFEDFVKGKK